MESPETGEMPQLLECQGRCPICEEKVTVQYLVTKHEDKTATFEMVGGTYPVHPDCLEQFKHLQHQMRTEPSAAAFLDGE
jgi:hypothetical protein